MWALLLALLQLNVAAEAPKRAPETLALIDQARSLAPEFSADILLRLAGSRLVNERAWKQELIEEAFRTGAHAQLPYRQRGERGTDTRSARAVWDNGLEALTLRTRAVEAMLAFDAQKSRALFEEIPFPAVPPRACRDALTPDLSAYYRTAAAVFERCFTPAQREKEEDLAFLQRIAGSTQSPAHVPPMMRLLFSARLTADQRQALAGAFAAGLDRVSEAGAVPADLVPVNNAELRAFAPLVIPPLRNYIVRQLTGPRCRGGEEGRADDDLPYTVAAFNGLIRALDPSAAAYRPISADESKPQKEEGYVQHPWWQSKRSKEVLDALKWLSHGHRKLPDEKRFWTAEERTSSEWNTHFQDTLKLIEGWKEDEEESAADWFGMVSEAYALLAEKVPPGKPREVAMGRFLGFMETNYAAVENHNFWFTQLHNLWRSQEPWLRDQLSRSANPVIALYAKVSGLTAGQ